MQLSDDQIQYLFRFTEKKLVRWYDLQIELVDHLASRIEEEMEVDKSKNFEATLDSIYKDFGIFGFAKVVQEKQAQLQRAARAIWWEELRSFFTWPKVILLALIVTALWTLSQIVPPYPLMVGFIAVYTLTGVGLLINNFRYKKARNKLLLLQFGSSHVSTVIFLYEMVVIFLIDYLSALSFCVLATIGILFRVASLQLYKKVKAKAALLYPTAFA
jgi:hypothetical protein